MNELFREIEDDIRRENASRAWGKIGKIMVAVSVAVVIGTTVMVVMQNQKESKEMEQTTKFMAAVDQMRLQDYKDGIATFSALASDPGSPYYGIAMLRKAQAQETSGDKENAAKTYQALAARGGTFGELAAMRNSNDTLVVTARELPFYYTESEWRGWQLLKAGKSDEAKAQFTALRNDTQAPFSLRQRMQEVVSTMNDEKKDRP